MAKRVYIVTGLGYGDEGKGKTVHWLCAKHQAHTVIRTGGPQAFHRALTASGQEHIHSQFGSGTLTGSATHLSRNMLIDPYAIIAEGMSLQRELGIANVFEMITIHRDALVITPFQAIANRLHELMRQQNRRGSVGIGVGETVRDAELLGGAAIRAGDLDGPSLKDKLMTIRAHKIKELQKLVGLVPDLSKESQARAKLEIENLNRLATIDWALGWFGKLASLVKIVDTDYVADRILGRDGVVVFENSQGVLLDRYYGFHPYTTKVRTLPEIALSIIRECHYRGPIENFGVLRAYHTRHGGGPFVAELPRLAQKLPDASNGNHPWQGNFRVGCFDLLAAKYALAVCNKGQALDGLVITCVDRIQSLGKWPICRLYQCRRQIAPGFLSRNGRGAIDGILVSRRVGSLQLRHQERLGHIFGHCSPVVETFNLGDSRRSSSPGFYADKLESELGVPVVAVSNGPTERDIVEFQ